MKHKNISEGVLDVTDEEGWMAKSQLYKIAKYAGELHAMIADTDELEPWMQVKITKAADYIGAVKHYMEYNIVSSTVEPVAQEVVPMDVEPEAVQMAEPEMVPMESVEEEEVTDETVKWPGRRHRPGKGKTPKPDKLVMSKEEDEEKSLEEDAEFKSIANEFIGNALLRILDEEEVNEGCGADHSKGKKKKKRK